MKNSSDGFVKVLLVILLAIIVAVTVMSYRDRETNSAPKDTENSVPLIDSVSPVSARIGETVHIYGKNFSGFEGDKYAWIEDGAGQTGIIYGNKQAATDSYIEFNLADKYCAKDTSYSGMDCPLYMQIKPGAYKIFVKPWGATSNKISFTVLP